MSKKKRQYTRRLFDYGISGTQIGSGVISGIEQNPKLPLYRWIEESNEMLRTDPVIQKCWISLKNKLLSASFRVEAGDESSKYALRYADFANEALGLDGYAGQMSKSFHDQLNYMLLYLATGFRYFEEIYKIEEDKDGALKWFLDHWADRSPTAHQRWLTKDGQTLLGVEQKHTIGKNPIPIPIEKLLLLTHNQEGTNWEGRGLLRPCFQAYHSKKLMANLALVGGNRWAVPIPLISVDREKAEQAGYQDQDIEAMIQDAESQAQRMISNQSQYIIQNEAVKIEAYAPSPDLVSKGPIEMINYYDQQIMAGFLSEYTALGMSATGARSVGEIHLSVFRRACISYLDSVCSKISNQTIKRLITFNFGKVKKSDMPKLRHYGLQTDNLGDALNNGSLPALVQAGILTPDDPLERAIRDKIGVGELTEESERSSLDRRLPLSPIGGASSLASELLKQGNRNE